MMNVIGAIKLKLNNGMILKEDARIQPYLKLGYGGAFTDVSGVGGFGVFPPNGTDGDLAHDLFYGAAGINFRLSERLGLNVQTGQMYLTTDQTDGFTRPADKLNDRFLQHNFGLTFSLGKPKDTDGDGVSDRKDKCPDTPAGVKVDENGCPVDTDKDGVPDYQDNCPDVAGVATLNGCPDKDNDGVADAQDQCPDQPGTAALNGCPDTDKDGVADKNDTCPDTPAGTQVDAKGCPLDSDGDGVPDASDKCPTVAGTVADEGCPAAPVRKVIPRGVGRGDLQDTTYIQFEFDSSVLRTSSYPILDATSADLRTSKKTVTVNGYASSEGTAAHNLQLSKDRANSVKTYLVNSGVDAKKVKVKGLGETNPVADNSTEEGRVINRRVEFKK